MKLKIIILILSVLFISQLFADASPKLSRKLYFFIYQNNKLVKKDKYKIYCYEIESKKIDTINNRTTTGDYWTSTTLQENDSLYYLNLKNAKPFKFHVNLNNKIIKYNNVIDPLDYNYYYRFNILGNQLIDDSPLFYSSKQNYLLSFFLTVLFEFIVLIFFFKKSDYKHKIVKIFIFSLLINLITHPLLWYLCSSFGVEILLLEFLVITLETILIFVCFKVPLKKAIFISTIINSVSFILGGIFKYFFMLVFEIT